MRIKSPHSLRFPDRYLNRSSDLQLLTGSDFDLGELGELFVVPGPWPYTSMMLRNYGISTWCYWDIAGYSILLARSFCSTTYSNATDSV
jgi:hypothetical protein